MTDRAPIQRYWSHGRVQVKGRRKAEEHRQATIRSIAILRRVADGNGRSKVVTMRGCSRGRRSRIAVQTRSKRLLVA